MSCPMSLSVLCTVYTTICSARVNYLYLIFELLTDSFMLGQPTKYRMADGDGSPELL